MDKVDTVFFGCSWSGTVDGSLDVVGTHGVGGLVGILYLGIFASKAVNPGGVDGLLAGIPAQLFIKIEGIVIVGLYTFVVSWVLFRLINGTMQLQLTEDAEAQILDSTEHSETVYNN